MSRSILIIGGGIAGLSAGCYALMNGYRVEIFEMHTQPGGLCTSWKRKGYIFDGCIQWLVGSNPASPMHRLWHELGAGITRPVVNHEYYLQIHGLGGKVLTVYTDLDRLEAHLKELAPADASTIHGFCRDARRMVTMQMPLDNPSGLRSLPALARMAPVIPALNRWGRITIAQFAAGFHDPFLREAFLSMYEGMTELSAMALLFMLAYMHEKNAGYPVGGSLAFAQDIEKRLLALGGRIRYGARVERVLVEDDRAVGVRLADGAEHRGDVIVSAADGHSTIFNLLEAKYADAAVRAPYEGWPIFKGIVQVSLGIARDLSRAPHLASYRLERPVTLGNVEHHQVGMGHMCYDPTLAPMGKSVLLTMMEGDYAYWKELALEPERYEAEKQRHAEFVIGQLEARYPGITSDIEAVDVATPLTTERYTGNWQGSMEGWLLTVDGFRMMMSGKGMRKTLPGLANFHMIGQWVEPGGGVPTAAMSARNLVKTLCKQDNKRFITTTA